MSESPKMYLDAPDPLSVMLTRLELTAEVYVNGDFCGTWAVDTAGSRRIPFHLIGDGQAWLHFSGQPARVLHAGDLVIFPQDAHHVIASEEQPPAPAAVNAPMSNDGAVTNMVCGFFEFRNRALFPLLEALPAAVILCQQDGDTGPRIELLIRMMLQELADARPGHYSAVDQVAFLLFIEVLRQQVSAGVLDHGLLKALFDPRLGPVLTAIHQRPEQDWTLQSLAEAASMSRSNFAQHFGQLVGTTPIKYLTAWRMSEARRLLETTSLSTAQIAERSGYESEAAFRKAFRNTVGEPPGAVRARQRA